MVCLEQTARMGRMVLQAPEEVLDPQEYRVNKVHQESPGQRGNLETLGCKALQAILETMATQVHLEVLECLDPLDHLASQYVSISVVNLAECSGITHKGVHFLHPLCVFRATLVSQASLVHLGYLVSLEPMVTGETLGTKVNQVLL